MKMKKLMIAAAAALWATVGMADVESANIVGYTTVDVPAGTMKMLGCQFETTQSTDVDLQNFVVGNFEGGEDLGSAPLVMILGADGKYTSYFYLTEAYDEDLDDFVPGWANADGDKVSIDIDVAAAFWFKLNAAGSITFNK